MLVSFGFQLNASPVQVLKLNSLVLVGVKTRHKNQPSILKGIEDPPNNWTNEPYAWVIQGHVRSKSYRPKINKNP
jgi:hypothetical protein